MSDNNSNDNIILKVEGLKKVFGDHVVLENINTTVKKGEVIAIIGPSGCGKSTLGKCMMRLTDLTDGQVLFTGKDISRQSCRTLRNDLQRMQMIFHPPIPALIPS